MDCFCSVAGVWRYLIQMDSAPRFFIGVILKILAQHNIKNLKKQTIMKTTVLFMLLSFLSCKKEESTPPAEVTPPQVVTPAPPLPDKIFSVRIYETQTNTWDDSFNQNWFVTYNLTTIGAPATAIDMYWLQENETITIAGEFKPAYPYSLIYAYVRSWVDLTDTVPTTFTVPVTVTANVFSYTFTYN